MKHARNKTRLDQPPISRRRFFDSVTDGLCGVALTYLAQQTMTGEIASAAEAPRGNVGPLHFDLTPKPSHHDPQARGVIHLCMQGGPSQVDLFDPKLALKKFDGKPPPRELTENAVFETTALGS